MLPSKTHLVGTIPFLRKYFAKTVCIAERRAEICGTTPTVSLILFCLSHLRPTIRASHLYRGRGLVGGILAEQGGSFASSGAPRRVVGLRLHPGDQPVHAWGGSTQRDVNPRLGSKGGDQPSELIRAYKGLPIPRVRAGRARANPFGRSPGAGDGGQPFEPSRDLWILLDNGIAVFCCCGWVGQKTNSFFVWNLEMLHRSFWFDKVQTRRGLG